MQRGEHLSAEHYAAVQSGALHRELRNITKRCNARVNRGLSPLAEDLKRIKELQAQIAAYKRGDFQTVGERKEGADQ